MRLYCSPLSGHAHRARLGLSLLGIPFEEVNVNLKAGENRTPEYLRINAFGQVPVLDDDGVIIPDSNAILVYVAKKYGRTDWLPETPVEAARVQRWLSVAAGQVAFGPCAARLINIVDAPFNAEEVIARSHALLRILNAELAGRDWIAADAPTIADVALYSYIARAPEGNVDLSGYTHVNAWLKRVEALPGFVEFVESPVGLSAAR